MPRKLREEEEGAIHHGWARGNQRRAIFADDRDRRVYLELLGEVVSEHDWICMAYCLMGNHIHALIETPKANLGVGMQRLHGDYARYFNDRHDLDGHLFQGRYGAKRIRSDSQLLVAAAYIALNPVEARLCERADDWPWGSFGATAAGVAPPWLAQARLLDHFASVSGGDGLAAFEGLVTGGS